VTGCVGVEGDLLSRVDALPPRIVSGADAGTASPAACGAPFDVAEAPSLELYDAIPSGPNVLVTYQVGDEAFLATVDAADRTSILKLASGGYVFTPRLGVSATGACVVFQGHRLAGQWRVFSGPFGASGIAFDRLETVSSGITESVGPHVVAAGGTLAVAFRQDDALAFATLGPGCTARTRRTLAAGAGLPLVTSMAHVGDTVLVAARRDARLELEWFSANGEPLVAGPRSDAAVLSLGSDAEGALVAQSRGAEVTISRLPTGATTAGAPLDRFDLAAPVTDLRVVAGALLARRDDGALFFRRDGASTTLASRAEGLALAAATLPVAMWIEPRGQGRVLRALRSCAARN